MNGLHWAWSAESNNWISSAAVVSCGCSSKQNSWESSSSSWKLSSDTKPSLSEAKALLSGTKSVRLVAGCIAGASISICRDLIPKNDCSLGDDMSEKSDCSELETNADCCSKLSLYSSSIWLCRWSKEKFPIWKGEYHFFARYLSVRKVLRSEKDEPYGIFWQSQL